MPNAEEREAYREKIRAQVRQWEARLEELRAKKDEAAADIRLKLNRQVREAERSRDEAMQSLRKLERRGGVLWQGTRDRLQSLADRLRETVRDLSGRVRQR